MKFSERWLREWVNPDLETDALVEQLTMAGLEVDGLEGAAGDFTGVVVGEIVTAEPHPDADKLRVCSVSDGEANHAVVCGAPNARAGIRVAFARVGAKLPGDFKIRKAKLRGVESFGMLCSAKELALGDDHDGIIELPEHCAVGDDLRTALELEDTCIDIDLTPNRGDCLSIRGVAREVGLLNNTPVTEPDIAAVPASVDAVFPVTLTDTAGCPRYLGRVIQGIDPTAQTPLWMIEKLRRSGIRSIDPTVDITNYVLLELGQPMHAFDLDVLQGGIDVRRAKPGERLTLLDGRDVEVDTEALLITDGSGPVALAGVMAGDRSGISTDTSIVFLECAYFSPLALAGTARRYGLHTDASQRYERGVDFELQEVAVERATQLLLDICGGQAGSMVVTEDRAALPVRKEVSVAHSRLEQLLGVAIAVDEVDRAFEQLKFPVLSREAHPKEGKDDDITWTIQAPSHRFDIEREADLVEEVCRVYGYNNIPARSPTTALTLGHVALEQTTERRLRELLADLGYLETVTYSFVDPAMQDLLAPGAPTMTLENPMSVELSTMRTTLLPGLLEVQQNNAARQADRLRLFEVGLCFCPDESGTLKQDRMVGGLLWGSRELEGWSAKPEGVDFFDAKGDVERLLEALGVNSANGARRISFASRPDSAGTVFHPGQYAELMALDAERPVGRVGRLHPEVEERMGGNGAIYAFELSADAILHHLTPRYAAVSKFPRVRRDLALVVDEGVAAGTIEAICRKTLSEKLVDFRFFDVYVGKGIDSNEKSIAIGLTLQAPSATLTDAEIGQFVQTVIDALANEVGARLR